VSVTLCPRLTLVELAVRVPVACPMHPVMGSSVFESELRSSWPVRPSSLAFPSSMPPHAGKPSQHHPRAAAQVAFERRLEARMRSFMGASRARVGPTVDATRDDAHTADSAALGAGAEVEEHP
jgi:hypothetical protein